MQQHARVGIAAVGVMAATLLPAAGWTQVLLKSQDFRDQVLPEVPHAGGRALGVVTRDSRPRGSGVLYATLAAQADGFLCLSVRSADGRYIANGSYRVKAPKGVVALEYRSDKLGRQVTYGGDDLAIGLWFGAACNQINRQFVPATWTAPTTATEELGVAVNAGAGSSAFFIQGGARRDRVDLARTRPDKDNASISHICWVGRQRLLSGDTIRIFRETPAGREAEIVFPGLAPRPPGAPR